MKPTLSLAIIGSKTYKQSTVNSMIKEAKKCFSSVAFITIDKVQIQTSTQGVALFYKGKNLLSYDAIYPRFSSRDFLLGEAVLKAIEASDVYCPVSLKSYQVSNHKFLTSQILSNEGVPGIISTLFISPKYSDLAIKETGYPVVMKILSGFAGKGVVLIKDKSQMNSVLDAVHLFEQFISTQKFVRSKNPGTDIRCYIIGDEVIAVKRISKKGDWRSNLSRGGTAKLVDLDPQMLETAKRSASILDMDICAVDLMDSNGKWVIIEANFMPGPFKKFLGDLVIVEWLKLIHKKAARQKKQKQKERDNGTKSKSD
jgi:ribosomal protein S6--L-glutamate ligase